MMRTRVKICGMTRVVDAMLAAELGADAIGLVFCQSSPRCVTPEQAKAIIDALPAYVTPVGVFLDQPAVEVCQIVKQVPIQQLQFHGSESVDYCLGFKLPFIKALAVGRDCERGSAVFTDFCAQYQLAAAWLFDTYHQGQVGGTGKLFDWSILPKQLTRPLVLAGGLNPDNVCTAIDQVKPYAVDINSGIETAPGIKDPDKLRQLFANLVLCT